MKNIELTEDHKSKLLEMCEKLFPEDEFTFDNDLGDDGFIDRNFLGENKNNLLWQDEGSHFHWFEFCVLDLATKLYNLNKRDEICKIELYRGDLIQNYHPIEYLYKEYQYYIKTK
jgi:hypothetical protein